MLLYDTQYAISSTVKIKVILTVNAAVINDGVSIQTPNHSNIEQAKHMNT